METAKLIDFHQVVCHISLHRDSVTDPQNRTNESVLRNARVVKTPLGNVHLIYSSTLLGRVYLQQRRKG